MRAESITWLCTDPQSSALVTYRGLTLGGMRIDADLPTQVTAGPIILQSEGAEVFYRDIEIQTITAIPPEFAAKK